MSAETQITEHSPTLNELFAALAKAQGQISNAKKDKKNPFFKSSYADLSSVWEACREPLSTNGLSVIQTVEGTKESMFLNTWLGHSSGQWIKSKLPMLLQKFDPQSQGSAITYARRYALSAMIGICADEDDDGEKAMAGARKKEEVLPIATITAKQAQELDEILGQCDVEFQDSIQKTLRSRNIPSLDKLPLDSYSKLKASAIRNRDGVKETV